MHMHAGSCGRARGLGEVREKIVKNSLFVYPLLENGGYIRTSYHHRLLAKKLITFKQNKFLLPNGCCIVKIIFAS